jgi:hypothetical protein
MPSSLFSGLRIVIAGLPALVASPLLASPRFVHLSWDQPDAATTMAIT